MSRSWFRIVVLGLGVGGCLGFLLLGNWSSVLSTREIQNLIARQQWQQAEREVRRRQRQYPQDTQTGLLCIEVLCHLGELDEAADLAARMDKQSRHAPQALFKVGESLGEAKRVSRAEQFWHAAITLEKDQIRQLGLPSSKLLVLAYARLGDLYLLQGRDDEARPVLWELYAAVEKTDPAATDFLLQICALAVEAQDPPTAIEKLEGLFSADPSDVEVQRSLAAFYLRAGQPARAEKILGDLLRTSPDAPRVWETWLSFLAATGRKRELREALERSPAPPVGELAALGFRATDYENHAEFDKAVDCYRKALTLSPSNYQLNSRLLQALRLAGRKDEFERQRIIVEKNAKLIGELGYRIGAIPRRIEKTIQLDDMQAFARISEEMGWSREARAWHELMAAQYPEASATPPGSKN